MDHEIIYNKIWSNWYDYLEIDTIKFLSYNKWYKLCDKLKIKTYDDYKKILLENTYIDKIILTIKKYINLRTLSIYLNKMILYE